MYDRGGQAVAFFFQADLKLYKPRELHLKICRKVSFLNEEQNHLDRLSIELASSCSKVRMS